MFDDSRCLDRASAAGWSRSQALSGLAQGISHWRQDAGRQEQGYTTPADSNVAGRERAKYKHVIVEGHRLGHVIDLKLLCWGYNSDRFDAMS